MKQEVNPDSLFCPDILDHDFLVILFQKRNVEYFRPIDTH